MKTAGLILAAGASSRMGTTKANLRLNDDTFLTSISKCLLAAGCHQIFIVSGDSVLNLPESLHHQCSLIKNKNWSLGMRSSIRTGLKHIDAERICIQPVDTPGVAIPTVRTLINTQTHDATVPTFEGLHGHPVVISRRIKNRLLEADDLSLRTVLENASTLCIPVNDPAILHNINTPQAHLKLIEIQAL